MVCWFAGLLARGALCVKLLVVVVFIANQFSAVSLRLSVSGRE